MKTDALSSRMQENACTVFVSVYMTLIMTFIIFIIIDLFLHIFPWGIVLYSYILDNYIFASWGLFVVCVCERKYMCVLIEV
jgi:hypothetical protein